MTIEKKLLIIAGVINAQEKRKKELLEEEYRKIHPDKKSKFMELLEKRMKESEDARKSARNKETIWKVTVTEYVLLFDKVDKPIDFEEKAKEEEYGDLDGTYLGYRQFDSDHWYLRRDTKKPENSGQSYRQWRLSMGDSPQGKYPYYCSYAWQPQRYYKYEGELYCIGANFL